MLDLIAGLGGKANIQSTENCFTRLRVNVADESLIDEDLINHYEEQRHRSQRQRHPDYLRHGGRKGPRPG
ncbi:MAG: PTS transporter subunit EIIB [Collinsella sp.]